MNILDSIQGRRILVIGDVMLDRYWWGSVSLISPEAPVPIVSMEKTSLVAGGAANVAANLAGLGAAPVLFGIKGDDAEGRALDEVLADSGIDEHSICTVAGRKTSIKTRIVAHSQHVVRIDQESTTPISADEEEAILPQLEELISASDAVIISDYAKGFLTNRLLERIIKSSREQEKLLVADPKGRNFSKYKGASVITPNKREAADATGLDVTAPVGDAGRRLVEALELEAVLITEGEDGMTLFQRSGDVHFDSLARDVYDVTGAGDTVIAVFAAAASAGAAFEEAAELANAAAGIVVESIGTTRITREMLTEFLASHENNDGPRQ